MAGAHARGKLAWRLRSLAVARDRWWHWGLAVLLSGAMVGVLAGGWLFVEYPDTLPVRLVQVSGDLQHMQRRRLEQAVAERIDGGFFSLDLTLVRERLLAEPWVAEVRVRRVWPDTLKIEVSEQQPLARWGRRALVNPAGVPFLPAVDSIPGDLPRLSGPRASAPEVVALYLQLRKRFGERGLKIDQLRLDERRAWSLVLDDGPQLQLGTGAPADRLLRFLALYPWLREQGIPDQVDLRYSNGFAVRWRRSEVSAVRRSRRGRRTSRSDTAGASAARRQRG